MEPGLRLGPVPVSLSLSLDLVLSLCLKTPSQVQTLHWLNEGHDAGIQWCIYYSTSETLNILKSLGPFPVHCTSVLLENGKR